MCKVYADSVTELFSTGVTATLDHRSLIGGGVSLDTSVKGGQS